MEEHTKKKKGTATEHSFWRAVGRRKQAVARVRLMEGTGVITINGKNFDVYFPQSIEQQLIQTPLTLVDMRLKRDVSVKVEGGGFRGQAEAVRHGISRTLIAMDPELKKTLRGEGLLTRDPRVKERKKPGLKRARRAPQFSKR
ncbi:30S ribosomal protein S9 [Candidatus Uhrbacteria bacterium]|nr:30S ribosomal protein S9 [Candidatus Uhrbacteria bacterium]